MTTETLTLKERVEDWTAEHCLALGAELCSDYHKRMVTSNFERYNGVRSDLQDMLKSRLMQSKMELSKVRNSHLVKVKSI